MNSTDTKDHQEHEAKNNRSLIFRLAKTTCLVAIYIAMGLFLEITGPTLKDLKWRAHTDYETIARAVAGRSVGDLVGSVIGGIIVDKIGRLSDLIIAICLACASAATVAIPWAQQIEMVWFLVLVQGLSEVIINVCGNKLILEMWKINSSAPMHALHLGFGIGSFLIPLIANPFLADRSLDSSNSTLCHDLEVTTKSSSSLCESGSLNNISAQDDLRRIVAESRIEYAYIIAAIPSFLFALVFLGFQFFGNISSSNLEESGVVAKQPFKKMINPATCANGDFCFGITIFILMFLQFFQVVGGERLYGKFIRTYAVDHVDFSKNSGSYVDTVFWIGFSAGRFAGFVLGKWIPIRVMLLVESSGIFLSTVILNALSSVNPKLVLWISTGMIGFFTGPLFPTSMAWTDYHLKLTGLGITVNCLGGGVGGMVYLWIMGYFYEYYGPYTFPYEVLVYGILTLIISLALHFVGRRKGGRFKSSTD